MSWLSDLADFFRGSHGTAQRGGAIAAAARVKMIGIGETSEVVRLIQHALRAAGAELVPDSEFGDITKAAVKAFQARNQLPPVGYVDVETAVLLDIALEKLPNTPPAPPSVLKGAPWMAHVRADTGIKEFPRAADNPIITQTWKADIARAFPKMKTYAAGYVHDATAFCGWGLGAAFCRCNIEPPFGPTATDKFMWADSWHAPNWGVQLSAPIPGCVVTFTRSGGGHVGVLEKIDGRRLWVRGYNQNDEVNVSTRTLDSTFTAATWPRGWPVVSVVGDISNSVVAGREV